MLRFGKSESVAHYLGGWLGGGGQGSYGGGLVCNSGQSQQGIKKALKNTFRMIFNKINYIDH